MNYAGPLKDEPIAVELHNTLYALGGAARRPLSRAQAEAWLEALGERLPAAARRGLA